MSSEVATKLEKPQLRRLLESQIKKNLAISIGLAILGGVAFQHFVCDARKQRYADFYKNYDAEKEFQRMKAAGLFQSG
ncbi:Cytochrome c oxidase subunit VIc [Nesidiocoris tenuis]|uniref:Cytochrome c oxidase subunit VIc n=1 Tax=Nesidiocoris tenuis TaxID=355587 RepID=A0ABN7B9Q7_9HEMI|nr:Cytochrome c oxidase subunit VIc [Nesidiocoris tenuis]